MIQERKNSIIFVTIFSLIVLSFILLFLGRGHKPEKDSETGLFSWSGNSNSSDHTHCNLLSSPPVNERVFHIVASSNYSALVHLNGYIQYHPGWKVNESEKAFIQPLELKSVEVSYTSILQKYTYKYIDTSYYASVDRLNELKLKLRCGILTISNLTGLPSMQLNMDHSLHQSVCKIDTFDYLRSGNYFIVKQNDNKCQRKEHPVPELGDVVCEPITSYQCWDDHKTNDTNKKVDDSFATIIIDKLEFELEPELERAKMGRFLAQGCYNLSSSAITQSPLITTTTTTPAPFSRRWNIDLYD